MIKNIFIPSFNSLEDGINFMEQTEYKTLFSVGINWEKWYNINGEEILNIPQQKEIVIISSQLPNDIIIKDSDYQDNKWYYDGDFIFIMV